jgi:hypothetical protein
MKWVVAALVAATTLLVAGGPALAVANAREPSSLHTIWLVPEAGLASVARLKQQRTVQIGAFRLHSGALQGKALWYTIRLRARLELSRARGDCILSAATNGATAAQIEVITNRRAATVSALGWIQGSQHRTTRSKTITIDFRNYLQVHGVHGGLNSFTVTLERLYGTCFNAIRLERGSGIATTTAYPEELQLLVPSTPLAATIGQPLAIPYEVTRRGGWPDQGATVKLTLPDGWRADGPAHMTFRRIGHQRKGTFRIIPAATGRAIINLAVLKSYNQPRAAIQVNAVRPSRWLTSRGLPLLLCAALLVTATALTRASWRRRKIDHHRSSRK